MVLMCSVCTKDGSVSNSFTSHSKCNSFYFPLNSLIISLVGVLFTSIDDNISHNWPRKSSPARVTIRGTRTQIYLPGEIGFVVLFSLPVLSFWGLCGHTDPSPIPCLNLYPPLIQRFPERARPLQSSNTVHSYIVKWNQNLSKLWVFLKEVGPGLRVNLLPTFSSTPSFR